MVIIQRFTSGGGLGKKRVEYYILGLKVAGSTWEKKQHISQEIVKKLQKRKTKKS